ncbi:MAG: hypothetical protein ACOYVG_02125 [Bacteroidota bacterium]
MYVKPITLSISLAAFFVSSFDCNEDRKTEYYSLHEYKTTELKSFQIKKESGTFLFPYYSNKSIDQQNAAIENIIIAVHGNLRKADEVFSFVDTAINKSNAGDKTLLIAPNFMIRSDLSKHHLHEEDNYLFWTSGGWKEGNNIRNTQNDKSSVSFSSMEVVDSILVKLCNKKIFPNLKTVVLSGHSAGGQFIQRYAAINRLTDKLSADLKLQFRFIVMNPSSYVYLDNRRPVKGEENEFLIPDTSGCSKYNEYKYGLEGLNLYASETGVEKIRNQFLQRDVVYLLGGNDTDTKDPQLDTTCAAQLQGINRLERGRLFYEYLKNYAGKKVRFNHKIFIVNNVGHDHNKMINSKQAARFLY